MKKCMIMIFALFLLMNMIEAEQAINHLEKEVKGVLHTVSPSIVKVISQNHRNYFATGIVLDKNHVITNTIITRYPFKSIIVRSVKGKQYPAEIVGKDNQSSILVLEIGKNDLVPIKHAKNFEVGDWIALVGAFYDKFPAINQGIVSSASEDKVILNAPVVPGISGGAVVNKTGELIGIIRGRFGFTLEPDYTYQDHSSQILVRSPRTRSKDLCIAVPAKKVTRVAEDLIKFGKIRRGWLGVSIDINAENVLVTRVSENSPADKGGIQKGDIILAIDGKAMEKPNDIFAAIKSLRPEQKTKIKILRDNREQVITATIGETKEKEYSVSFYSTTPGTNQYDYSTMPGHVTMVPEKWESIPKLENFVFNLSGSRSLGIETLTLTSELAEKLSVKEGYGLLISKINEKSTARKAGLKVADIIVAVDRQNTKKLTDLRKVLTNVKKEDPFVQIKIYRNGKARDVKVAVEKSPGFGYLFEPFKGIREQFDVEIDEEKTGDHNEIIEIREGYLIINGKRYELDQVKKYKKKIEQLRKERDKYKLEVKKLEEILEREKNRKKKATI